MRLSTMTAQRIVTASFDRTARVWETNSGQELAVLRGHGDAVVHAEFSHDGTLVVTASHDRTARVWETDSGQELAVLRGHDVQVIYAAFNPDSTRIVTVSSDRTARVWETDSGAGTCGCYVGIKLSWFMRRSALMALGSLPHQVMAQHECGRLIAVRN